MLRNWFHSPKEAKSLKRQPKIEALKSSIDLTLHYWCSGTDCFVTDLFHSWQNNWFYFFETLNDLPRIVGTEFFKFNLFSFSKSSFHGFFGTQTRMKFLFTQVNCVLGLGKSMFDSFFHLNVFWYLNSFVTVTLDDCELFALATIGILGVVHFVSTEVAFKEGEKVEENI